MSGVNTLNGRVMVNHYLPESPVHYEITMQHEHVIRLEETRAGQGTVLVSGVNIVYDIIQYTGPNMSFNINIPSTF